jgi:hypothetical protein
MNLHRLVCVLIIAAGASGCVQIPRQAYNAVAAKDIKSLLITVKPNQERYEAAVLAHPGASFGLIGGLIAAADIHSKSTRLTVAIEPPVVRLQERFGEELQRRLTDVGYQPRVITVPAEVTLDDVHAVALSGQSADAVLGIELMGSFLAAGPTSDYFPRVIARVRKWHGRTREILYEDTISYGYSTAQSQMVQLASNEKHRFSDIEALVRDPAITRSALIDALPAIAMQIAADLKRVD